MIKKELFETIDQGDVYAYTLTNGKGLSAKTQNDEHPDL